LKTLSLITVTHNAADTLADCLDSVARQQIPLEHILVDGASTDHTLAIAQAHRPSLSHILSEPDRGPYDAMNKGIQLAQGEILGILNADDTYASDTVLQQVLAVFSDPTVEACYGDLHYVKRENPKRIVRYWKAGAYDPKKFYWGWMPPHPTFFVRRSLYERFGLFNLDLGSAADYEIMLRFLLKGGAKAVYLSQVLVKMRVGGLSNRTLAHRLRANRMDRQAWMVNGLKPYPGTLALKPLRKLGQWLFR